jgi:transcriptional regulator with XRE-family HTH domain
MTEMGVTDAAVYMWETGVTRPRTSILVKLARLYHCSVDELLIDNPGQSQNKAKA